jgi:hypothetical protein
MTGRINHAWHQATAWALARFPLMIYRPLGHIALMTYEPPNYSAIMARVSLGLRRTYGLSD